MRTIKLVRHGQSQANAAGYYNAAQADHAIELTERGHEQALAAGQLVGKAFFQSALVYTSPYTRARQTCDGVLAGAGVEKVLRYEDPRLREVEHGYEDFETQQQLQDIHGTFYYRMSGGESPADCYDRICTFLESLGRQATRKQAENILIVSHGITIRCFVMRFLHLSVEDFGRMRNPWNGDVITIGSRDSIANPQFVSGQWAVSGIRWKERDLDKAEAAQARLIEGMRG